MARLVGLPCRIASQLILDGVIVTPGVHALYMKVVCDPLRAILESEGVGIIERSVVKLVFYTPVDDKIRTTVRLQNFVPGTSKCYIKPGNRTTSSLQP